MASSAPNMSSSPQFESTPGGSFLVMKIFTCNDLNPNKNVGLPEVYIWDKVKFSSSSGEEDQQEKKENSSEGRILNEEKETAKKRPRKKRRLNSESDKSTISTSKAVDPEVQIELMKQNKLKKCPYPYFKLETLKKMWFNNLYRKSRADPSSIEFVKLKAFVINFNTIPNKNGPIGKRININKIHPDTIYHILDLLKEILRNINRTKSWKGYQKNFGLDEITEVRKALHNFCFHESSGPRSLDMRWKFSEIYNEICNELVEMSRKAFLVKVINKHLTLSLWSKFLPMDNADDLLELACQGRTCAFQDCQNEIYPDTNAGSSIFGGGRLNNFVILSHCHHLLCLECGMKKLQSSM